MSLSIIQDCLVCRQTSKRLICSVCRHDLVRFSQEPRNLMLWPKIARGLQGIAFQYLFAVADYQWPLSNLLTGLKFSAKLPHAKALADLFIEHNQHTTWQCPQAIIPIPLHSNRFLQRKFNQSIEISKHLSRQLNIANAHSVLQRHKNTQAQTTLNAAQRKQNMREAFTPSKHGILLLKELQHVAIFDDVVTTGATANGAYLALKKINPQLRVDIWSICVALKH